MEGGIRAWEGLVAEGAPEAGMAYFDGSETAGELIALAWLLENGSRRFYTELSSRLSDEEARELFRRLSLAEEHHKTSLVNLYREIAGVSPDARFPESVISTQAAEDVMEGGMKVGKALEWAQSKSLESILELSISLETNSYDLYIKMERRIGDEKAKSVFRMLSGEEKQHLGKLAALLGRKI